MKRIIISNIWDICLAYLSHLRIQSVFIESLPGFRGLITPPVEAGMYLDWAGKDIDKN